MSSDRVPTAAELLEAVKTHGFRHGGQTVSEAKRAELAAQVAARSEHDHELEAAAFCEAIIAWLNEQWNAREFTPEQRIFSVALATINLRQHFPEERGGKEFFDRIGHEAWVYYEKAQRAG